MITKDLRQKVLSLAIRGKLVPQDPNDEPAEELLKRVNPAAKPITEDAPFDVPQGWCWVRLGEISKRISSGQNKSKGVEGDYVVYGSTGIIGRTNIPAYNYKQLLIARVGANAGYVHIANGEYDVSDNTLIVDVYSELHFDYIYCALIGLRLNRYVKGAAQPLITGNLLKSILLPLPPLAEQQRIVSKLEELLASIDTIERAQEDLNNIRKWLRSKLLSLAISGKLVPQDPNDEPAEELLKRIDPYFTPQQYDENLPQGWCACQLKDILNIVMGQSPKGESVNKVEGLEFHQGKICFTDKYLKHSDIYTREVLKVAEANSLLLSVRAPVGDVNITDRRICIGRGLCALQPKVGNLLYFFYLLSTLKLKFDSKATGTTFNAISKDVITSEVFPLPPLAEQQRIVSKLEELFAVLDKL